MVYLYIILQFVGMHRLFLPFHNTRCTTYIQVKTTQPSRYLVRPNQGIIQPGTSEQVSILLVEKDRQELWSIYESGGQAAIDTTKDKFLVQSCELTNDFSSQFLNGKDGSGHYRKDLLEKLTSMWTTVSKEHTTPIYNKKLHVHHVGADSTTTATATSADEGKASIAASSSSSGGSGAGAPKFNIMRDFISGAIVS